jgi:hypothetical protein
VLLRKILKCLSIVILLTGCGYHFPDKDEKISISIPYVKGDEEGKLTKELIKQISTSTPYEYVIEEGDLILKTVIIGSGNEQTGFRYDRKEISGKLERNLVVSENRRVITAEITLIDGMTHEILYGPIHVTGSADYDYSDVNSLPSLSFVTPSGKIESLLQFSLGQMDSVEGAEDDAALAAYRGLAKQIARSLNIPLPPPRDKK